MLEPGEIEQRKYTADELKDAETRAKNYSKMKMAQHRAWQSDLTNKIRLRDAAIAALPKELRVSRTAGVAQHNFTHYTSCYLLCYTSCCMLLLRTCSHRPQNILGSLLADFRRMQLKKRTTRHFQLTGLLLHTLHLFLGMASLGRMSEERARCRHGHVGYRADYSSVNFGSRVAYMCSAVKRSF